MNHAQLYVSSSPQEPVCVLFAIRIQNYNNYLYSNRSLHLHTHTHTNTTPAHTHYTRYTHIQGTEFTRTYMATYLHPALTWISFFAFFAFCASLHGLQRTLSA